VPRLEPIDQEDVLEQREVVADGRAAELEGGRQLAHVEEAGGLRRGQRQEARKGFERGDARQIAHVAMHDRIEVAAVPGESARPHVEWWEDESSLVARRRGRRSVPHPAGVESSA